MQNRNRSLFTGWSEDFKEELKDNFYVDETAPSGICHSKDKFTGKYKNILLAKKGSPAGSIQKIGKLGYWLTSYKHRSIRVHRLIWLLVNGDISPTLVINHINCNGLDNRISNLELVCPMANSQRRSSHSGLNLMSSNASGENGIAFIHIINGSKNKYNYYVEATFGIGNKLYRKKFKYNYSDEVSKMVALGLARSWRKAQLENFKDSPDFHYRLQYD